MRPASTCRIPSQRPSRPRSNAWRMAKTSGRPSQRRLRYRGGDALAWPSRALRTRKTRRLYSGATSRIAFRSIGVTTVGPCLCSQPDWPPKPHTPAAQSTAVPVITSPRAELPGRITKECPPCEGARPQARVGLPSRADPPGVPRQLGYGACGAGSGVVPTLNKTQGRPPASPP